MAGEDGSGDAAAAGIPSNHALKLGELSTAANVVAAGQISVLLALNIGLAAVELGPDHEERRP